MAIKITQIKPEGAQKSAPSAKDYSGEKKGNSGSAVSGSSGRIQITKIPGAEKQRSIAASRKTTRETEHADELDKQTTPSASRQASKQTFGQRVLKGIESGLVSEGANLANIGGVATDRRGGTEMSGVYRRQAETLDKQIAALEKTLKDPTMTAQDIKETNEALAIARSEREKYGKVIESGEKTASSLYDTADKGYSFAQKLSEESTAGTKGIKKGVLSIVPAATQIGLQTAERMVAPGMDVAGRALSVAGGNAADYRRKAGEQYDAEKAKLRATVSALGVAAGGALSKGVNAAGLKLLRAAGKQNYVLPNIALGGASAVGYAAGETGASELSKAMTDEDYAPDWKAIGQTAMTAFAFGAISSAINAAAITGRNKKYMNELNDAAKERYDYAKHIIEDPRATAEQKAAGAQSVMDAVDKMRYTLDDLQVVGAQKEVDAMREFLLSIYGEMLPYTNVSARGIGTGASGLAPVAPVGGGIAPVQTGGGMGTMQENAPTAPISPRAPGAAAVMQNSTPAATPTARQQNTMPVQPAAAQEGAQGVGKGNLTPVPQNAAQGAQEASTSVDTNPKNHTPEEQKRVEDYRAATDSGIVAFVQKVRTLKNPRYRNSVRYPVSDVSAREASAVLDATGVNTSGFTNILTGGAVDHIEKRHGASGKADKSMQDLNDLGRVGYILENFDGAELLLNEDGTPSVSDVWKNSDGTPAARMLFTKKVDGVYYTAVATPDSNAGVIAIESAFMSKEKGSTGTVLNMENISPQVTPEAPQRANASFDNTVPQESGGVKAQEGTESAQTAQADNTMTAGGMNHGGQEVQNYAGGAEFAEGTGQRADAVAAENDLHGGDRGRRPSEPGAGGAGELRSTTAEGRRRNRELTQRRREIAWEQPLTSAAALGVQGGTSDETLHVLPEEDWDDELRGFSDWAHGKGVKRVTMVTGLLQVETENGPVGVRGIINRESGEMVLRVDGEKRTASEIGKHEVGHLITEEENVRAFMETVRGGADWRGIYEVYERCYEPLTNGYVGMTAEERELYVWEEIMEDAYAGIDSYGQRASRYHERAVDAIERAAEAVEHPASEPEGLTLRAVDEVKSRGPPERFSVEKTDDGRAVAVVDDDILSGIDTQTWDKTKKAQAKAAAKAALLTFKDGIQVNGIDYKVNRTSRREYTRSEDTERLYREDKAAFADKMRAAANADDIITATTDWTRDGTLTHPRTDSFVDFAHGDVLIQSGNNQYDARVVVGITSGGEYVFYDVVDMEPTSFAKKEETPTTALSNKALGDIHGASLDDSISKGSENVKYSAFNEEVARQLAGKDREKVKFSAEDTTDSTGRELTAQQREYFKDSKVRDEQGRLLTLYHGTTAYGEFTKFRRGRSGWLGPGIYLTSDLSYAERYANSMGKGNGHLYKLYANAINPLVVHDGNPVPEILFAAYGRNSVYKNRSAKQSNDAMIITAADIKKLREKGYDGIRWDFGKSTELSVFSPEQIKNVSNETPTDDPDIRFSAEDEGDEWNRELERMPESVQEAVRRVKDERSKKPNMQEFPNLDAYLSDKGAQQEAEKAERLRDKGKDEFKGTEALEKLGVKIENSAGDYSNVEQLIANDRAAKTIQRETRKAIKRLGATPKEQNFALNIASGLYDEADIPATMNRGKVVELADYYSAEQSMSTDFIRQRRAEINENLQEKMKDLFDEHFDGEFTKEKSGKGISPESGFALYHRTPQRSMRAIFGWDRGQQINEAIFEPVYVNEQERKRFVNRMHDEVRTFKGADGEDAALTQRERALAQLMIEGKAVEEMVGKSEIKQQIIHAAENLLDGAEMTDAAREFGLHGKEERELAQRYADWLETKRELDSGEVDRVRVENAAAKYSGLYNEFYAAINDFLVAHGYEPIGFIKGYAPHFQPEAESGKLERALKAIGVDLGAEVGKLPASIAGLTKEFKPNKRYNPFFQHRKGTSTDYDIQKGFEKYIDYLSDVLYHTDDVMRVRAAAKYFRRKYAPDDISALIEQAEDLKFATPEEKELFLKTNGIVDDDVKLSYQAMNRAMEKYTDSLFNNITQTTKYGDLVTWLDDYANKLAGKQLFNDRNTEKEFGRMSLNIPKKLVNAFTRANVAGNLSSALNQTAQLPMIAGELGPKYVAEAIGDIASGKAKGDFADRSDFLTEKRGIRYLTSTKGDKFTAALFWPLERMDYLMSTIAVRGRYRKELAEGKSEKEALRAADRWGRDMMGSRSKGTAPLTFQSKTVIAQMVNLFQVEALNSWEHVTQDLFGPGLREMEEKLGKKEASRRLAGIIVGTLLGAFILNRVDEELYGGTPAQFDVLGLLTGFLASGNGLSTNEQLGVWVDDVWQKLTGERLFGTDEDAGNGKFNLAAAAEDTIYNISNDIPYARNVAGVFGVGDQTLPMPDLWGTATGIGKTLKKQAAGKFDSPGDFWSEVGRQLMGLVGDTVPGGRQLEKFAQGGEAILRGGSYQGTGDNKRLQYPVESLLEDPWTALRAAIFGKNALPESRTYWAAGGKALSAAQTRTYQELVDMGADREVVYDAIQKWRKIDKDDSLTDGEREAAQFELVRKLKLTNEQKERLHDDLSRSSRSYAAAQEAQKQGISAETYAKYKDTTADLTADKDENGNAINGSKKAKVLDAIDKMQLSKKQKDWLYLDAGYSEKDIGKAPWNS